VSILVGLPIEGRGKNRQKHEHTTKSFR